MVKQRNKRLRENEKRRLIAAGAVIVIFLCLVIALAKSDKKEREEIELPATQEQKETAKGIKIWTLSPENYQEPFNRMSMDWGSDDLEGFEPYRVPKQYAEVGGLLPEVVQVYTHSLCKEYGVDYEIILAIIEIESAYQWDAESGIAYGYMQIVPEYHAERMERLHITDITDPYQNIRTGIDYLAELVKRYDGNYEKALTAYRWGPTGADQDYFSKGQQGCEYSEKVLKIADRVAKEIRTEGGAEDEPGRNA